MIGMLQIITYMLGFYFIIKGVEILQIALASSRENRGGIITIGFVTLVICIIAAFKFASMQDHQANHSSGMFSSAIQDYPTPDPTTDTQSPPLPQQNDTATTNPQSLNSESAHQSQPQNNVSVETGATPDQPYDHKFKPSPELLALLLKEDAAENTCKADSTGNDPVAAKACNDEEQLRAAIAKNKWCNGSRKPNGSEVDRVWLPCKYDKMGAQ